MKSVVFVDNKIHLEFISMNVKDYEKLPEQAYIYYPHAKGTRWFRRDITPVLLEDVPKETRALALLMS
jgi:hypothetical protein